MPVRRSRQGTCATGDVRPVVILIGTGIYLAASERAVMNRGPLPSTYIQSTRGKRQRTRYLALQKRLKPARAHRPSPPPRTGKHLAPTNQARRTQNRQKKRSILENQAIIFNAGPTPDSSRSHKLPRAIPSDPPKKTSERHTHLCNLI